jgi:hypothetical protein
MNRFLGGMIAACVLGGMLERAHAADQPPSPPIDFTAPPPLPPNTNAAAGPKIKFENMIYDFGRVQAGEVISHTFYFTNIGSQTLTLSNLQPSCGCTTAGDWTRRLEPGQTGMIPMQFNSGSFGGQVHKTITVFSNDRGQPAALLQIKGTVWKPIEVAPMYAILNVQPEAQSATNTVRIVNNMDQPLTLSPPESNNKSFTAQVVTNQPGKQYQLIVSAVPPLPPGNSSGQITIKTSATNMPVITVMAVAYVQPAVSIMPPQLGLQAAPLPSQVAPNITIVNNTSNRMVLSEPSVNAQNVTVQMRELSPGKTYVATLTFPQGFEIGQGQQVAFTVKTDHPKYPLIKVPVFQMPRPVTTPKPAAASPAPAAATPAPPPSPAHASTHS